MGFVFAVLKRQAHESIEYLVLWTSTAYSVVSCCVPGTRTSSSTEHASCLEVRVLSYVVRIHLCVSLLARALAPAVAETLLEGGAWRLVWTARSLQTFVVPLPFDTSKPLVSWTKTPSTELPSLLEQGVEELDRRQDETAKIMACISEASSEPDETMGEHHNSTGAPGSACGGDLVPGEVAAHAHPPLYFYSYARDGEQASQEPRNYRAVQWAIEVGSLGGGDSRRCTLDAPHHHASRRPHDAYWAGSACG